MTKLKIVSVFAHCLLFFAYCLFLFPSPVLATSNWTATNKCVGLTELTGDVATLKGFECLFGNIISIIIRLMGITTFVTILIGGFKMLTSAGDAKGMQTGQQTLTLGIVGLILAISAWFILSFIGYFTGTDLIQFKFGLD